MQQEGDRYATTRHSIKHKGPNYSVYKGGSIQLCNPASAMWLFSQQNCVGCFQTIIASIYKALLPRNVSLRFLSSTVSYLRPAVEPPGIHWKKCWIIHLVRVPRFGAHPFYRCCLTTQTVFLCSNCPWFRKTQGVTFFCLPVKVNQWMWNEIGRYAYMVVCHI